MGVERARYNDFHRYAGQRSRNEHRSLTRSWRVASPIERHFLDPTHVSSPLWILWSWRCSRLSLITATKSYTRARGLFLFSFTWRVWASNKYDARGRKKETRTGSRKRVERGRICGDKNNEKEDEECGKRMGRVESLCGTEC